MSSFFDDASLVMIPSGYKDGKVYSVKPTSGAGDLTFTRNSNATRVDANGLIEKVRTNLTLYSNDFSNAAWVKTNVSGTSGQSGYDGTNNGWLFTSLTAANSSYHQFYSGTTEVQTFSVYLKAGTTNWVRLNLSGAGNYYFDIQNGVLGSIGTAGLMPKITAAGNGYYRCSITNTTGNSVNSIYVFAGASDGVLSTSAGDTFYIQAVQREAGGIATDYIETTTTAMSEFAGVTASSVADVPRLDYSGGATCPSLLLEPQRTNLIDNAEYLNGWSLQSGVVVSNNETTSPEGVQNAGIATAAFSNSRIQRNLGTLGSNYIFSAFVKSDGVGTRMELRSNVTGDNLILDVAASGEVTHFSDTAVGNNYDIESYGNGWYRVWFEGTTDGASSNYYQIYPDVQSGNRSVYVWGIQMEAGSYPTSYIPSYGTTVTRLAETTKLLDMRSNGVSTTGAFTVFFDISDEQEDAASGDNSVIFATYINNLSSGIISARKYYQSNPDGNIRWFSDVDGGTMGYSNTTNKKWAAVCNGTSVKVFTDGALVVNYTGTGSHNSLGSMQLNYGSSDRTMTAYKQCLVFPSALSDTECENLTA